MDRYLFGEYVPDLPSHLSNAIAIAENVIPLANGYGPIGQFAPATNGTMAGACKGAAAYRYASETFVFAATTANIYRYMSTGHVSLRSGLTTNTAMRFCPYGKYMIATNGADPIQRFDPGAPASFAALGGTPPTALYLGVVKGFLIAGFAGGNSLRVQWSDTGNPASWTPGGASLAGQFDMPAGGDITGVVGGEYGLIFQERRIVRMSFTGDDAIWQFDEISTNVGCVAPGSLVTWGRVTFFLSDKGFMRYDGDTGMITPIGDQKTDKTFLSKGQTAYYDGMSAAFDPVNTLYIVTVPSADPAIEQFIYSDTLHRWTTGTAQVERLFASFGLNFTLEDLDSIYSSIDDMGLSLDSPQFKGGRPILMLYDGLHRLGSLSGPNAAASIVDSRREMIPGRRTRLRAVRPITNAASGSVTVYGRASLADADAQTVYATRTGGGVYRVRENWTLIQLGLAIPAGANWTYAQGFDADGVAGGRI